MNWNNKIKLCALEHTLESRKMNDYDKMKDIADLIEFMDEEGKTLFYSTLYTVFSYSNLRLRKSIKDLKK